MHLDIFYIVYQTMSSLSIVYWVNLVNWSVNKWDWGRTIKVMESKNGDNCPRLPGYCTIRKGVYPPGFGLQRVILVLWLIVLILLLVQGRKDVQYPFLPFGKS